MNAMNIKPITLPARGRTARWLLSGAAVVVAAAAIGVAALAVQQHRALSTTLPPAATIVVELDAGAVVLTPSTDGQVHVRSHQRWSWLEPAESHEAGNGVLTLRASCPERIISTCSVDVEVGVPAGTVIRVHTGAGDIRAAGIDVRALDAQTDAGAITARLREAPERVGLHTGAGDIDLALPAADYRIDAATSIGEVSIDHTSQPTAPRSITVHTGVGDIHVGRA